MRDFYTGNGRTAEETGGCCAGGGEGENGWNDIAAGMPGLTKEEQDDIMRLNSRRMIVGSPEPAAVWGGWQQVPPILVPERKSRPPKRPEPGWGNQPPKRPEPGWGGQPPKRPAPGLGGQPPKRPEPGWGGQPPKRPEPGLGGQPPKRPEPGLGGQPPKRPEPGWGNQPPKRPEPGWGDQPPKRPTPGMGSRNGMPYIKYDYDDIIEEEKKTEEDLRMLQAMYPEAVRAVLPCVEEICDKMEYEGSMMFDEYPDKNTVRRLSEEIYEQTGDVWPREPEQKPDGVMSMQYREGRRGPLGELIQILLLQEMHHRRCRHRRCRPHMF